MKVRLLTKTTGAIGTEYENKSIDEIIVGIASHINRLYGLHNL